MKRLFIFVFLLAAVVLVACTPESEKLTVEVTRVVTEISEVEVTKIVEIEKEVTRVVEVPVEVTRVVEEIVVVTPTSPPPTTTPDAPEIGTRGNPYPIGEAAPMLYDDEIEFNFMVLEAVRGDEAWSRVLAANQFNDEAPPGTEYIMIKVAAEYTGPDAGTLEVSDNTIELVSQGRVYDYFSSPATACCIEPSFEFELLEGGYGEGWFAWAVPPDSEMSLKLGPTFFTLSDGEVAEPEADTSSSTEEEVAEPEADTSSSTEEEVATVDASGLDLDLFTNTSWALTEPGDEEGEYIRIVFEFRDDGTLLQESTLSIKMGDSDPQPMTTTRAGTWQHQGGNTVCLIFDETICSEWIIEGDSLIRDNGIQIYTRS